MGFQFHKHPILKIALIFGFIVLLFTICRISKRNEVDAEFYWIPYCPYGIEAASNVLSLYGSGKEDLPEFYYIATDRTVVQKLGGSWIQVFTRNYIYQMGPNGNAASVSLSRSVTSYP